MVFDCIYIQPTLPKILIGYSDITALHILFNQHYKISSIHEAVSNPLAKNNKQIDKIINLLSGGGVKLKLTQINSSNKINNEIKGKVIGGNLTVLCNMISTDLNPKTKSKILLLEDVNEKGYHIHRHLVHLKNAKILDNIKL